MRVIRHVFCYALAGLLVSPGCQRGDPAPPEVVAQHAQILDLNRKVAKLRSTEDWTGVTEALQEIAAIDPEHPVGYNQMVGVQADKLQLDETPELL